MVSDNRTIVAPGPDNTLWVDAVSAQFAVRADPQQINGLSLSANGALCATAGNDGVVKTWNTSNGSAGKTYAGHKGPVFSVSLSPANQQVAAGGVDKKLLVWKLSDSRLQLNIDTPATITSVRFSADSTKLICAGADHAIRSFSPVPPNPQPPEPPGREPAQIMQGHTGAIHALAFAPDNRTALSAAQDGSVKSWSVAASSFSASLTGHSSQVYGIDFSPDGKHVVSASNDKTVRLWDAVKNKVVRTLSTQPATVYAVQFSPDGKTVATGGADKSVRLIDVSSGNELLRFTGPDHPVYSITFSPDGKRIAGGGVGLGDNRSVFVWEIDKPQPIQELKGHRDDLYRVQFNPRGTRLLSAGYSGTLAIWDPAAGKPVFETRMPIVLYSASYSSDGKRVAVTASDHKSYLINVPDNAQ